MKRHGHKFIDETGKRYGRLVVIEEAGKNERGLILWKCVCDCNNETITRGTSLRDGTARSCGRGRCHSSWGGGRHKTKRGYINIYNPEHPNASKQGQVAEHVLIMSEYLGRPLKKGETVHHKNGVRDDNRIENLELWASNHPPGQRVSDLLTWAKEIIKEYEPDWVPSKEVE